MCFYIVVFHILVILIDKLALFLYTRDNNIELRLMSEKMSKFEMQVPFGTGNTGNIGSDSEGGGNASDSSNFDAKFEVEDDSSNSACMDVPDFPFF